MGEVKIFDGKGSCAVSRTWNGIEVPWVALLLVEILIFFPRGQWVDLRMFVTGNWETSSGKMRRKC